MAAELSPKVANWVFNVIQPQYINKQVTYSHIYLFLSLYLNHKSRSQRFKIRTSIYTSSKSGLSQLLIELFGNIRVSYELHPIPISIWIPFEYPYSSGGSLGVPIVFITPDNSLGYYFRPGNHVDSQGRLYHPYLSAWAEQCSEMSLNRYNLIELIEVLKSIFANDYPLFKAEDYVPLPQKPARVPLSSPSNIENTGSPQHTGQYSTNSGHNTPAYTGYGRVQSPVQEALHRQTTGPPLPPLPNQNACNVPLKYQSPLPLPPANIQYTQPNNLLPPMKSPPPQNLQYSSPPIQSPQPNVRYKSPPVNSPQPSINPNPLSSSSTSKNQSIEDLMDKQDEVGLKSQNEELLAVISQKINSCLDIDNENSINHHIYDINTNSSKITALHSQLNHHNIQANANSEILENHIEHLTTQLLKLTSLNNELCQLDSVNASLKNTIATSSNTVHHLDDLITADLALINQLYDVVAEIKANKDTINLIGGSFQSQSELINDNTIDNRVKTIRAIGRETFWLELIKDEIAGIIGLSK